MPERKIVREAHAKINVFLRVLRRRRDGYHEVESLVLPISLADRVTVRMAPRLRVDVRGDPKLATEVGGDPEPASEVPAGGLNLALVAALALADGCPQARGAEISIDKRVPIAAGLGGGSADAAATLEALNELWGCELGREELIEVGARVGSDVPALLLGGPVVVHGRGERVEPIAVGRMWWVVTPLALRIRSPDAYRWWDEDRAPTGPDPAPLLAAASIGDPEALAPLLANDLEVPVAARHPAIAEAKEALLAAGALGALMSGSGSSLAGLARDREHAEKMAETIEGSLVVFGPP